MITNIITNYYQSITHHYKHHYSSLPITYLSHYDLITRVIYSRAFTYQYVAKMQPHQNEMATSKGRDPR